MHLFREVRFVWPATNHFFGIIKQNSVKNVHQLLFTMNKFRSVYARLKVLMSTMVVVLNAKNLTFGIPKQNNVNGVPKRLCIKK
jgi:hypothetical protein